MNDPKKEKSGSTTIILTLGTTPRRRDKISMGRICSLATTVALVALARPPALERVLATPDYAQIQPQKVP